MDSFGTVYSRRCLRAGRLASSIDLERFVAVASGTHPVVDAYRTVHNRSRLGPCDSCLLMCWNVALSSRWGYCCALIRGILQPTTSADCAARSSCGVETPAAISSRTYHSRRPRRARRLATSVASGRPTEDDFCGPEGSFFMLHRRLVSDFSE